MTCPTTQISLPGFTLDVHLDCVTCKTGTVIRNPDGIEARFNSPECLVHLLEGLVGRRTWQAYGPQIEAQIRTVVCACV